MFHFLFKTKPIMNSFIDYFKKSHFKKSLLSVNLFIISYILITYAWANPLNKAEQPQEVKTQTIPTILPCPTPPPKGMSCIPGGYFIRGSDEGSKEAKPQARIWIQTFLMDHNEVTVAAYKKCVRKKKCDKAGPHYADFNRPKQPINGVSWFDAQKFCKAYGKRLPTESEWEKAARGTDARLYPWGNEEASCKYAVIKDKEGRSCGVKKRGKYPNKGRVWIVGKKPPNQYGLYDMAGNSYEWVADWFSKSYEHCGVACFGINPKGPCQGKNKCKKHRYKVVRGGSWYWPAKHARTFHRRRHVPSNRPFHHFGFRCAKTL
jgi:formylglycine-generating enzyme